MSYFQNVKFVPYKFGTSDDFALHQDISAYVDLIDQVRDNNSFYQKYTILDGDRPDVLSQKFYGSTKHYWTFFLMNDNIRARGWPLTNQELLALVQEERNNTILTTRADLTSIFKVGSTVSGATSSASGTIIKRNLDLGQLIISGEKSFVSNEIVSTTEDDVLSSVQLSGVSTEWEGVWRYEDSDGQHVDINPYNGPGAQYAAVSYYDRYVRENDELKEIVIIKPDVINSVFEQFQDAMSL